MRHTPLIAWHTTPHTQAGMGQDGRHYLLEDQDGDVYAWVDGDPMLDLHASMDDARAWAETAVFIATGRLSPVDVINATLQGLAA